jgi:hypothetical protein
MFSVTFADHTEAIKEKLNRKLEACIRAAAKELAQEYQLGLQETIAPPHSGYGEIPHAYAGHKPGGFGPVNGWENPNNTTRQGFARDQRRIGDFLANYVDGGAKSDSGTINGFVGFSPSHVVNRRMNYLLMHNQSGRPWVLPLFMRGRQTIANVAKAAFESTE